MGYQVPGRRLRIRTQSAPSKATGRTLPKRVRFQGNWSHPTQKSAFPSQFTRRPYTNHPLMTPISNLSHPVSPPTGSIPNNFTRQFETYLEQNKSFTGYLSYAIEILHEYDLVPPDEDRITLIVESALTIQSLFFTTCLHRPEQVELHQVFKAFVVRCVLPPEKRSNP
jgi:hypothetical protein